MRVPRALEKPGFAGLFFVMVFPYNLDLRTKKLIHTEINESTQLNQNTQSRYKDFLNVDKYRKIQG